MDYEMPTNVPSKPKKSNSKKPSQQDLYLHLANIIAGRLCLERDRFPVVYHAVTVDEGRHMVLRQVDESGIVMPSSRESLAEEVMRYVQHRPEYIVKSKKDALNVVDWWLALGPKIEMPPAFLWADEQGLAFSRLPWAKGIEGPTPTWDKLMARMTNAKAFMGFLASVFDPTSKNQQYVWCYGGGGNGKSAIDRVLAGIFGPSYHSSLPPGPADRFWTRSLRGKRLVVFPDCNAKGFPASGLFKSLCANDAVQIEEKNGPTYSARLGCRFIFMSNEMPSLSTEQADLRRVIFCKLDVPTPDEVRDDFEADLWNEAGAFVSRCIAGATAGAKIETDSDEIADWVETLESHHDETLQNNFTIDKTRMPYGANPVKVQEVLRKVYKSRKDQLDFLLWLERVHGIKKTQWRDDFGNRGRTFPGLFANTVTG